MCLVGFWLFVCLCVWLVGWFFKTGFLYVALEPILEISVCQAGLELRDVPVCIPTAGMPPPPGCALYSVRISCIVFTILEASHLLYYHKKENLPHPVSCLFVLFGCLRKPHGLLACSFRCCPSCASHRHESSHTFPL